MPEAPLRVTVAPDTAPDWVRDAVRDGGATLVAPADADAVIWFNASDPGAIDSSAYPTAAVPASGTVAAPSGPVTVKESEWFPAAVGA